MLLLVSAMYTVPSGATSTPIGKSSIALVAAPSSPEKPAAPVPANVLMTPPGVILRTRLPEASAT
jgi:hypothetical protein